MSQLTMQSDASAVHRAAERPTTTVPPPKPEDEGLSTREIRWIPLMVPFGALTLLLAAAAALSTA